jgi:cellulose 1,4-beta-cellobiosidase
VPVALVIEPDSLPNLVTNTAMPACGNAATQAAYKAGVVYAVEQFAAHVPDVALYLDAAHGGWLGWQNNMLGYQTLVSGLNIVGKLRGFALNVANYQPLGQACSVALWCLQSNGHGSDACCADACNLISQWNPANNEHNYALEITAAFPGKYVIIDTGRNGVGNMRTNCGNWCNPRGAGLGQFPTATTALPIVDAYFWLKTPGESDGCTQMLPGVLGTNTGGQCARFDGACASTDSIGSAGGEPRAPQAGQWFDYQIKMLMRNAKLGVVPDVVPGPAPTPVPQPTPVPVPVPQPTPTPTQRKWRCQQCTLTR